MYRSSFFSFKLSQRCLKSVNTKCKPSHIFYVILATEMPPKHKISLKPCFNSHFSFTDTAVMSHQVIILSSFHQALIQNVSISIIFLGHLFSGQNFILVYLCLLLSGSEFKKLSFLIGSAEFAKFWPSPQVIWKINFYWNMGFMLILTGLSGSSVIYVYHLLSIHLSFSFQ